MNVLDQVLNKGLPTINEKVWYKAQTKLKDAFLRDRGLTEDELSNYNSYLTEILLMVKEHYKPRYVDPTDQLHTVVVKDLYYVRPYRNKVGLDNPEASTLHGDYISEVRGTVIYQIKARTTPEMEEEQQEETKDGFDTLVFQTEAMDMDLDMDTALEEEEDQEEASDYEEEQEQEQEGDEVEEESDMEEEDQKEESEDSDMGEEEDNEEEEDDESKAPDDTVNNPPKKKRKKNPKKKKTQEVTFSFEEQNMDDYNIIIHESVKHNHHVLDIPVWIRSALCFMSTPYADPKLFFKEFLRGSVFLVSRNFKVCPYEETYVNNRVLAQQSDKVTIRSKFHHFSKKYRTNSTLNVTMEYPKIRKHRNWLQPPRFLVEIPHEKPKQHLPVTIMAMAFGWMPPDFVTLVRMFLNEETSPAIENLLGLVLNDIEGCRNQFEAIQRTGQCYTSCRKMENDSDIASYVAFALHGEVLPNLIDLVNGNLEYENQRKGYVLAEAVAQLILVSDFANEGKSEEEKYDLQDKRSYVYKRITTPGEQMTALVRKYMKEVTKNGNSNLKKMVDAGKTIDVSAVMNRKLIRLVKSVKNGVFDAKSDAHEANQNKTQMLITGFCSDTTRMQSQNIVKSAMKKNSDPKRLMTHPTQTGRVDLYLTPQSERCGIVRYKAIGCIFTPLIDPVPLMQVIYGELLHIREEIGFFADEVGNRNIPSMKTHTIVKDLFSGVIGWVKNPLKLYQHFVRLRRRGIIYEYLSLEWDRQNNVFLFNADEGRMVRPLIVMSELDRLIDFVQTPVFQMEPDPIHLLMEEGMIEYLDASEEYSGLIFTAESLEAAHEEQREQTHMEVHGIFSLSVLVVKSHMNMDQGPRRMYTGCMENRTMSLKIFPELGTTTSHSLMYGQTPLMSDPVDEALGLRLSEPNGINVFLGVLSHRGNMEDANVMKRSAVERGLGWAWEDTIIIVTLNPNTIFKKPGENCEIKNFDAKYEYLQDNGFPKIGTKIPVGGAVVGRVYRVMDRETNTIKEWCDSKFNPLKEEATVSSIEFDPPGARMPKICRVILSVLRQVEVGNKFHLAHGQKSTVGALVNDEDMPWVCSGNMAGVPFDMLINTCSFKRITQGLLMDMLKGQARCMDPTALNQYHTVFLSNRAFEDKLRITTKILKKMGLKYNGKACCCLGTTGEMLQCQVFCGPAYMRVLPHRAKTKLRSRERGPVNELTQQTSSGKKNFGGLMAGEMEKWNNNSCGISFFGRNVSYTCADKFRIFWCTKCQIPAIGSKGFALCKSCNSREHVERLFLPYTTNLVQQELMTIGYGLKFGTSKVEEDDIYMVDEETYYHEHEH